MTYEEILGTVARGWCNPANSHKVMDEDLAIAIALEVEKAMAQPDPRLLNLLCRVHRDGGHYIAKHGVDKAVSDADMLVAQLNAILDAQLEEAPELHVGNSRFESWFSEYSAAGKGTKQQMRDAYAAGMGDDLAQPEQSEPVAELGVSTFTWLQDRPPAGTKLYTAPPLRELTDEEIYAAIRPLYTHEEVARIAFEISIDEYRAILAVARSKTP